MTMMNTMTFSARLRFLLLAATLFSMLWAPPLQAALLKDVRLGEYKTFTRIVFEFDQAPPAIPDISVQEAELRVIFKGLTAELRRKIATQQSPHVDAVQIWLEDNHLSAVFKVDTSFKPSKISSLSNPPRLLMDIHCKPPLKVKSFPRRRLSRFNPILHQRMIPY